MFFLKMNQRVDSFRSDDTLHWISLGRPLALYVTIHGSEYREDQPLSSAKVK